MRFTKNLDFENFERETKEPLSERPGSSRTESLHEREQDEILSIVGLAPFWMCDSLKKYTDAAEFARTLNFLRFEDNLKFLAEILENVPEWFSAAVALSSLLSILELTCLGPVE